MKNIFINQKSESNPKHEKLTDAVKLSNDGLGMVNAAGDVDCGGKVNCEPQIEVKVSGCEFSGNYSLPASGGAVVNTKSL